MTCSINPAPLETPSTRPDVSSAGAAPVLGAARLLERGVPGWFSRLPTELAAGPCQSPNGLGKGPQSFYNEIVTTEFTMPPNNQQIQIKATDEDMKGRYANALQLSHNKEEFFLDFMLLTAPVGQLVSRLITSPGHMKRIYKAMDENIKRYEESFGKIEEAEAPPNSAIGFKSNQN